MLSDLEPDELEDLECRLYSQVFHSNVAEESLPNKTIPSSDVQSTSNKRINRNRYFQPIVFNEIESNSIQLENVMKCDKRRLAKQAKLSDLLRIKRAATEDAELFRNLNNEERKKVYKYQKRQRYLERKRQRKAENEVKLIDDYNRRVKCENENAILISDEECNIVISDDEIKPGLGEYYADDVIFVEADAVEPEIIDLDPTTPNESMRPPSDVSSGKTDDIIKDVHFTPECNDFLDTPAEFNNYNAAFLKPKSLAEALENESSCSAVSDNSTPLKGVVFNEIDFNTPTKSLFNETNLKSFGEFITPKRKAAKSIPSLLTPSEVVQIKENSVLAHRSASDSSSESEFDDETSKVGLISKKLPMLTPFDDTVFIVDSSSDVSTYVGSPNKSTDLFKVSEESDSDGSPKKKLIAKRNRSSSESNKTESIGYFKPPKTKKKKRCSNKVAWKVEEEEPLGRTLEVLQSNASTEIESDDVEKIDADDNSEKEKKGCGDEVGCNVEEKKALEVSTPATAAEVNSDNDEKIYSVYDSESNDSVELVYDQKNNFETIDITDDFPPSVPVLPKLETSDESETLGLDPPDDFEHDISLANLSVVEEEENLQNVKTKNDLVSFDAFWTEDMDKFYGTWNIEFDTKNILQTLPDDPNKWKILDFDRLHINIPHTPKGPFCRRCRKHGHVQYYCRNVKELKCSLCGNRGHQEARCPNKMCTSCGSQDGFSAVYCRKCFHWRNYKCCICGMLGHIDKFCPDLWRRYHLTIKEGPIVKGNGLIKPPELQWCSGCGRRGHLEYMCNYVGRDHHPVLPYVVNYVDHFPQNNYTAATSPESPKFQTPKMSKKLAKLQPPPKPLEKSSLPSIRHKIKLKCIEKVLFENSNIGLKIMADINVSSPLSNVTYEDGKLFFNTNIAKMKKRLSKRFLFYRKSIMQYLQLKKFLLKCFDLAKSDKNPVELFMQTQLNGIKQNYMALNAVMFGKYGLEEGAEHMKILNKWKIILKKTFVYNQIDVEIIERSIQYVFMEKRPIQKYQELLSHYDPAKRTFDFDPKPVYLRIDPDMEPPVRTEILPFRRDTLSQKLFLTYADAKLLLHTKGGNDCLESLRKSIQVDISLSDDKESKCGFIKLTGTKSAVTQNKAILKEFLHGTEIFPLTSVQVYKQIVKSLAKAKVILYTENCGDVYRNILADEDCLRENLSSTELKNNLNRDFVKLHCLLFFKFKMLHGPKHVATLHQWKNKLIHSENLLPKTVLDEIKNAYFYIFDEKRKSLDYAGLLQSIHEGGVSGSSDVRVSAFEMRERFRKLKVLCFSRNFEDKLSELLAFEKYLTRMKFSVSSMRCGYHFLSDIEKELPRQEQE